MLLIISQNRGGVVTQVARDPNFSEQFLPNIGDEIDTGAGFSPVIARRFTFNAAPVPGSPSFEGVDILIQ